MSLAPARAYGTRAAVYRQRIEGPMLGWIPNRIFARYLNIFLVGRGRGFLQRFGNASLQARLPSVRFARRQQKERIGGKQEKEENDS